MKSSNPMFKDEILRNTYPLTERPMTVAGTVNKLLVLSLIMLVAVCAVYYQFSLGRLDYVTILTYTGAIVGLITIITIAIKKHLAKYLAPIYAFAEGAFLSGLSCFFESAYPGIVIQAISITFLVVFAMGIAYKAKLIEATNRFKSTILTATFTIGLFYIISFVLMFFNVNIPYFTSNHPLNIFINFAIAVIAALNLIIDFDFIENGEKRALPSLFEWHGAVGLLVTIVWLYIEILRLLSRLKDR